MDRCVEDLSDGGLPTREADFPKPAHAQFPDAVSYNALLAACAQASDGYRALDILEEMQEFAIPIDVGAYNSALKACCVAGLVDKALELFAHMMSNKLTGDGTLAPTRETMTIIMQYYSAIGDVASTEATFENMEHVQQISADERTYMVLLEAYETASAMSPLAERQQYNAAALGRLEMALKSFSQMNAVDRERLLTKTVAVYAQSMDVEATADLLDMFAAEGLDPSPQTYAALLNLHERCADGKAAVMCLRKMILQGLPPSPNFIGRAGMALLRQGDAAGALRLWEAALVDGISIHHFNEWSRCHDLLGQAWLPPDGAEDRLQINAAAKGGIEGGMRYGGRRLEGRRHREGARVDAEELRAKMDTLVSTFGRDLLGKQAGRRGQVNGGWRAVQGGQREFERMLAACDSLLIE